MPTDKTAADRHPITPPTMRRMHTGFTDHGLKTDEAVHAYLSALLGRDVESRKDLTEAEGRQAIEDLAETPRAATPSLLRKLRAEFPTEAIGKLPRSTCSACSKNNAGANRGTCDRHPNKGRCNLCGNYHNTESTMHLDYVGHADVTARLLEVDPQWSWEPFTQAEMMALPPMLRDAGLWVHLTVLGITRPGFGDADGKSGGNAVKECIGDALRNAAMRFGVALDLWAKGDRTWLHTEKDGDSAGAGAPASDPGQQWTGPSTQQLLDRLGELAISEGTTDEDMSAKWRERHGGLSMEAMRTLDPWHLQPLIQQIEDWLASPKNPKNQPTAEQKQEQPA